MAHDPHSFTDLFLGAVTVGERGQIVIPAQAREAYGIQGGDKLLVFHHPWRCGVMIVRVEDVHQMLQGATKLVEEMEGLTEEAAQADSAPE
jgi:AbrB family looped-hinge helix DNA binding protein